MDPAKVVPAASVVIFVGALVFMLWGNQLGVTTLLRQVPPWAIFALVIGVVFVQWRLNPQAFLKGWGRWALLATVAIALVFGFFNLFRP